MRTLLIPREHGAWGLLLIPLLTGVFAGLQVVSNAFPALLLAVAAVALFWMRTPAEIALGTSPIRAQSATETNWLLLATAGLGSLAMLCISGLLWSGGNRGLLLPGACAAVAFAAQAVVKKMGKRARMAAQLIGSAGLTVTAPAAWYVITGRLDAHALGLWMVNWIFAGNQIHFVQTRLHGARLTSGREKLQFGRVFFLGQLLMTAVLALIVRLQFMPTLCLVAFLPLVVRGFWWFRPGLQPLVVRRLGWSEMAHGTAFALLLIATYRFCAPFDSACN
jgi:hypothetical protein